jgi:hypothetical protein
MTTENVTATATIAIRRPAPKSELICREEPKVTDSYPFVIVSRNRKCLHERYEDTRTYEINRERLRSGLVVTQSQSMDVL